MIPAGYIFKRIVSRPSWIRNEGVDDIYSVSSCCSDNFADYITYWQQNGLNYWQHNGFWFFNTPSVMEDIASRESIDCAGLSLFYYEVHEHEYDECEKTWSSFGVERSFETNVKKPDGAELQGFDVVSFSMGSAPECSPLSCNSLANEFEVNCHCLFRTFEEAKAALNSGKFAPCEPGPFRIFAIYLITQQGRL